MHHFNPGDHVYIWFTNAIKVEATNGLNVKYADYQIFSVSLGERVQHCASIISLSLSFLP